MNLSSYFLYRLTVGDLVLAVDRIICRFAFYVIRHRSVVIRPVKERTLSVLLAVKIIEQGEGV